MKYFHIFGKSTTSQSLVDSASRLSVAVTSTNSHFLLIHKCVTGFLLLNYTQNNLQCVMMGGAKCEAIPSQHFKWNCPEILSAELHAGFSNLGQLAPKPDGSMPFKRGQLKWNVKKISVCVGGMDHMHFERGSRLRNVCQLVHSKSICTSIPAV